MKIALVYNRESQRVINLFGVPNREKYGLAAIKRLQDALRKGKHQVQAFEGDKDLIRNLEEFMPRVLKHERPGLVFNVSYGIQGQARYTHVPAMLEMIGIPYVGSGPLAHSLALDKVVAKMIFRENGVPTPEFAVLPGPEFDPPGLAYPLIVKPKNEAVSFGIRVVHDDAELREAAQVIFDAFGQSALAEQFIDGGPEINVGLLGNNPPETFAPVELDFGESGPKVYTEADKKGKSGRTVAYHCPARIDDATAEKARQVARRAFEALGCCDCARVDMRLDAEGNVYVLEINSLPSLGARGSYVVGADHAGLDFAALVNRLVETAAARYFGTPHPPSFSAKTTTPPERVFAYLTQRRDRLEKQLEEWVRRASRTGDLVALEAAAGEVERPMLEMGLRPAASWSGEQAVWLWETAAGYDRGTLLIVHLDIPTPAELAPQPYRREPEWIYGEGVASRAPLVMLLYALRALNAARLLRKRRIGVLLHADEGLGCRYSSAKIREAAGRAGRVLVLRPGHATHHVIVRRRGQRTYTFTAEGKPQRLGKTMKQVDALRWACAKVEELAAIAAKRRRVALAPVDLRSAAFPMHLTHRVTAKVRMAYGDAAAAADAEKEMRAALRRGGYRSELEQVSDRPPMAQRKASLGLFEELAAVAGEWEIPLEHESALWPSVAGLVPASVPALCGLGPVARDLYTPFEAVQRLSLVQRTLLLAQFLAREEA